MFHTSEVQRHPVLAFNRPFHLFRVSIKTRKADCTPFILQLLLISNSCYTLKGVCLNNPGLDLPYLCAFFAIVEADDFAEKPEDSQ